MPASIGVNLRVTGNCRQGGRKYMEDCFSVAYQQTEDEKDLEYAFFGIYDGHGGVEAASFAKEHLMETIIKHKNFWSDNDEDVLRAIKDGYIATHYAMWREQSKWPRTSSGLPSTAGTTASVAFIRRGKIYIGHVGDSGIILGYQEPGSSEWKAKPLTKDHKPENPEEMKRIESCGGKVVSKSGVPRVVWNRPKIGHQGPVRRSTPIDEIPFLAVARSLGDLWSYNSQINQFVVSPDPDCSVLPIDTNIHRCLIFGTDGLFNMLSPSVAVHIVQQAERHNECEAMSDDSNKVWLNPSKLLVERALDRWHASKMRADNTSAVTLMLDPPGPPRAQVLKDRKKNLPESGLKIMTRYDENAPQDVSGDQSNSKNIRPANPDESSSNKDHAKPDLPLTSPEVLPQTKIVENEPVEGKTRDNTCETTNSNTSISSSDVSSNYPLKERNGLPKLRESTSFDPREPYRTLDDGKENNTEKTEDNTIQINEISSSNIEENLAEEDGVMDVDALVETDKETKSNLKHSGKKLSKPVQEQEKKSQKRKLEPDEGHYQQRKSLRLSLTQKFLDESKKPAPCTLAEEKLKKLAEEAEKSKITPSQDSAYRKGRAEHERNNNNTKEDDVSRKLSITQKILTSKKVSLKKKTLVKTRVNRRKLKMVLETVIGKSGKRKISPSVIEDTAKCLRKPLRVQEKAISKPEKSPVAQEGTKSLENTGKSTNKLLRASRSLEKTAKTPKKGDASIKAGEKQNKSGETIEVRPGKPNVPLGNVKGKKVVISEDMPKRQGRTKNIFPDDGYSGLKRKLSHFQRQSKRNASQRTKDYSMKKSPSNTSNNNSVPQSQDKPIKISEKTLPLPKITKSLVKESVKTDAKTEKKLTDTSRKGKLQVLNTIRETRSLAGNTVTKRGSSKGPTVHSRNEAKENIKGIVPKDVKNSSSKKKQPKVPQPQPPLKNSLRQRIQDKTKTLKRSVLKKSR